MKNKLIVLALAAFTFQSCQKVINVNLNDSDPQYIVEGNINDGPGPYTVKLTRSVNFSSSNSFPEVTGAVVAIKDVNSGITDTLQEATPGNYITHSIVGQTGHTYELYIKADDHVFTSSSTMQQPVALDTIDIQKSVFGGDDLYPVPVYTDPTTPNNRYKVTASVNHQPIKDWTVRSDNVTNGQVARFPFYYDTDDDSNNPIIKIGDSVFVNLQTIDSSVYEFYRTLDDTREQNAAALSNPLTNIKGGAMGYFSAGPIRTMGIKVQ